MNDAGIPVAEAARDFLQLLDRVERDGQPAILVREGKPVATLSPIPSTAATCAELANRWPKLEKLTPVEASLFADDMEHSRASLPTLSSSWD